MVRYVFIIASVLSRLINGTDDVFLASTGLVSSLLVFVQFFAHCFADVGVKVKGSEYEPLLPKSPINEDTALKECPEVRSSFINRISFAWITGLVLRGYRRDLTSDDVWDLQPSFQSESIIPHMETEWRKQLKKSAEAIKKEKNHVSSSYCYSNGTENHKVDSDDYFHLMQEMKTIDSDVDKQKLGPSFFAAMMQVFGYQYIYTGIMKFLQEMTSFFQPQLLKLLINFVSEDSPYEWHGYVFAFALFFFAMCRTMLVQQYFHGNFSIGMKLRSATIGLVYRKALRLSGSSRKDTTVGEIVNLMAVDSQKLQDAPISLHNIWSAPMVIIVAMFFLWQELGVSCLAGILVMICLIPINGYIASKIKMLQALQMRLKDQRIKLMSEILGGIKVLKLYAWEASFQQKIIEIRNQELVVLRRAAYLNAAGAVTWFCAPFLVTLASFAVFVLSSPDNILSSQKAFVSLSLFNILNMPLANMPTAISAGVQLAVSLRRINRYLTREQLDPNAVDHDPSSKDTVTLQDASFSWDADDSPVLSNVSLSMPDGKLYAVVGAVGSGKSSLIHAILGEMVKSSGRISVRGSVAYVPQQAWCQNASLQDNILFGREMGRKRYERVLDACALKPDLEMLTAGDRTEIGEKGINLSGGQKQRVSLARAVYQDADLYLLDDPLSAVDSHVGKHLFERVISSDGLLRNKTRLLVTHGLSHLPKVDCIVVLKDGRVSEMGSYSELVSHDGAFAELVRTYLEEEVEEEDEEEALVQAELRRSISALSDSGSEIPALRRSRSPRRTRQSVDLRERQPDMEKLITTEKAETGSVRASVFVAYIKGLTATAATILLLSYVAYIASQVSTNLWLSVWSEDTSAINDTAKRDLYLGIYGTLGAAQTIFILIESVALAIGTFYASQSMHSILLRNVMRTPMSFFDTTPLGRILNRFGKDVDTVDINIPQTLRDWLKTMANVIGTLVVVSIASPVFLVALVPLSVAYYFAQRMYICTARQLKRIDSVKRSPIYSHFQESIVGATSVRAYRRENDFIKTSDLLVDDNQRVWYPTIVSYRWVSVVLQTLGNLIILLAAVFAVVSRSTIGAGLAGASVSYSLQVTGAFTFVVRMTCDLETYIVAVERIMEYAELTTEAAQHSDFLPPPSWPSHGRIEFRDFSLRYRPGLDLVLRRINAVVEPGEKIGIVGRTGAGKSSLTLGLFRILEPADGDILIDDISVTALGLHDLRSRLTIIPQDPVLFSGSLRMNLDPFNAYSDAEVWTALDQAHLRGFVAGLPDGLEHHCTEGGENLSVGQRQLVCLARALLRRTKLLVLDEATAAVDLETDDLIQKTIRKEFKGCTILTIAHRLNTVLDYDRIMVLDKGQLKELDTPGALLRQPDSIFHGMCHDAGLV